MSLFFPVLASSWL